MTAALRGLVLLAALLVTVGTGASMAEAQQRPGRPAPPPPPCGSCRDVPDGWFDAPGGDERRREGDSMPYPIRRPPEGDAPAPDPADYRIPAPPPAPGADPAAPPPPPQCTPFPALPPIPSWDLAPLPSDGAIGADPVGWGLTGLESRFWWSGTTTVGWSQVGVPGLRADCTVIPAPVLEFQAYAIQLQWDLGETAVTTDSPGSADAPAARWTYSDKHPTQVVSAQVLWVGSPAGSVTTPGGTRPHPVGTLWNSLH